MRFNSKLSLKQFQGIFFFTLGIILIYSVYNHPETYKIWLFVFSILFIIHGVDIFFWDLIKKFKIIHSYQKNNYDSKAEQKIADYFKRKNIIFEHHPKIKVQKSFHGITPPFFKIQIEPDFFLPEFDVFVEYWGLIDDERYKKEQYDFKMKLYKENNLDIISLYPKNMDNLEWVFTSKLLELFKQRQGIDRDWK